MRMDGLGGHLVRVGVAVVDRVCALAWAGKLEPNRFGK